MRQIWVLGVAVLAICGPGAMAQDKDAATIQVTGVGSIETPPDAASISYSVRGEGATSDEAVRAMVSRKTAVEQALRGPGDGGIKITTGTMRVSELRGAGCANSYDRAPQVSEGACAVRGYSAYIAVNVRVSPAGSAGTLSGLAAKAGASEVNLTGFMVSNPEPARRRALDAAIADGRAQAEAIASSTGVKLGALLRVSDPYGGSRASLQNMAFGESRPRVEAPIRVDMSPAPVSTSITLVLTYAIVR